MNLATIAYKSIRQRALSSSLTALSVALGVTLMVAVLVINGIFDRMFNQTASGYDLIVGPKGSELQLVLNTIYRVSQPIENLPYKYYEQLKGDTRIEHAIPLAIGDVTEQGGFPIVGTIPAYFDLPYMPGRKFRMTAGSTTLSDSFDAIIGSRVARTNNWKIGSQFAVEHGGADTGDVHDEKFKVVGILAPTGTPNDKTVFLHLDGFYLMAGHDKPLDEAIRREADFFGEKIDEAEVQRRIDHLQQHGDDEAADHDEHGEGEKPKAESGKHNHPQPSTLNSQPGHHDEAHPHGDGHHHQVHDVQKEVTAILVDMKGKSPDNTFAIMQFQAELKEGFQAQAVNPVKQISWLMTNVVGNVRTMLVVLTGLIIVVSGVGIFVSIYNSMADRRREIAIMRALGAQRQTVFSIVLAESIILCIGGGLLGLLLGHGLVFAASPIVEARSGILLDPFAFEPLELVLFAVLLVLASLVGFVPGLTAYRTDVAKTLAD